MSIETWGEMTKSQIDATKIEERMTQMISEHNDDPTAHMADDQSIGLHRINDVIDHPASSVVPDKFNSNQPIYYNFFTAASTYPKSGTVNQAGGGAIYLLPTSASRVTSVNIAFPFLDNVAFPVHDIILDFTTQFIPVSSGVYNGYFIFGIWAINGFGFKFTRTTICLFKTISETTTYGDTITFDYTQLHNVRLFLSEVDATIYLYIDGVQITSLAITLGLVDYIYDQQLYFNMTTGNASTFAISMLRAYYTI